MSVAAAISLLLLATKAETGPGLPATAEQCLIRKNPAATLQLLSSQPNSAPEAKAIRRFGPHMVFCRAAPPAPGEQASAEFRAAISRAAVTRYLKGTRAGPNSNPNFSPNLFPVDHGFDEAVEMQGAYRLAQCVVTIDFNGAAHLIETIPGENEERIALETLVPDIAACVDKGRHTALSRQRLRTAIEIVFALRMAPLLRLFMPRR